MCLLCACKTSTYNAKKTGTWFNLIADPVALYCCTPSLCVKISVFLFYFETSLPWRVPRGQRRNKYKGTGEMIVVVLEIYI